MIITKNYFFLIENGILKVGISEKSESGKVSSGHNWAEYDTIQECVDYILLQGIENFDIPVEITKPENVPNYYLVMQFSDNVLTKYEDGEPVYENHILTAYVEMNQQQKDETDSKKWSENGNKQQVMLGQTDIARSSDFGKPRYPLTGAEKIIIDEKRESLRDFKDYSNPFDPDLLLLLGYESWGIDEEKIKKIKTIRGWWSIG